ncbi:mechanosensitive ion channel domain-containing protein [Marinobacter sp. JSM 1782161]|uniref:mechanosensitive ion channel domain-containing protein n=1 Tax=Marinobacter sp. JSM 1782161 TaxID=2685906 RepID=UPI0014027346|nr:mechanosensitive ion channel domain-containing protein [Marinobacter sp. JSM 1782161]
MVLSFPRLWRKSPAVGLIGLFLFLLLAGPVAAEEPSSAEAAPEQSSSADASDASNDESAESEKQEEKKEPPPEPKAEPVQPNIEEDESEPLKTRLPSSENADIRQQIQALRESLDERLVALDSTRNRLAYAQSLLKRLDNEYESFELRLERAGLNLTEEYANLLQQRLDRLERQTIATSLSEGIKDKLSAAREEQLRLEEYEAVLNPEDDARGQLRQKRAELLRQLHGAVTDHIDVLNEYFNTVGDLQTRIDAYRSLLQQRLFWLPSAEVISADVFLQAFKGVAWLVGSFQWDAFTDAVSQSFDDRGMRMLVIALLLGALLFKRRRIQAALKATGKYVGNVGRDRFPYTLMALFYSVLMALPGVLALSLGALLIKEGNDFFSAVSRGLGAGAFIMLLLNLVHKVARQDGLGERHFKWNTHTLASIRRQIPLLLCFLIPGTVIIATLNTSAGDPYQDSLGRIVFAITSAALAYFAHRIIRSVRRGKQEKKTLRVLHWLAVGTPIVLAIASLLGYHYTAVQLERNAFVSICWLAFTTLLYYLALRGLSVRERRMTLERLREQRAAERKLAETREAAESSGEGLPPTLDMPEMDLKDINQQSTSLVRIIILAIAVTGLWLFWDGVIPALQLFDDMTLWTISTSIEGGDPLPITLGDLMIALLFGTGTVLAAKNLPGTLEVLILSRLKLEPGSGYAITTLANYIIVFLGVIISLSVIGVQWSQMQWLVAALGVGLGFGLQEIVANFVSGIILLFERPIRVGDTVSIGGITGTVSRIRIRATTLVDWDRKEQIIPNKTFVTQDLTNWTLTDAITRVIIRVGVAYGSDVDKVRDLLYQVAVDNERVVDDPAPAVFCVGLGDSRIDFEVRVFVRDLLDFMPLYHELHAAITRALSDAGVSIPFPQRDIHIRTAGSELPGTEAPSAGRAGAASNGAKSDGTENNRPDIGDTDNADGKD